MMIVGRIGTAPLAASGIAFNLNMIVFMPMLGLGVAVSAVVGRHLGADHPELAERATWSAFWMSLVYMTACGAAVPPGPARAPLSLRSGGGRDASSRSRAIAVVLLRFVALYSLFDMMNVIFAAALRGAGDTFYPLALTVVLSWGGDAGARLLRLRGGRRGACTRPGRRPAPTSCCSGILMLRRFRRGPLAVDARHRAAGGRAGGRPSRS